MENPYEKVMAVLSRNNTNPDALMKHIERTNSFVADGFVGVMDMVNDGVCDKDGMAIYFWNSRMRGSIIRNSHIYRDSLPIECEFTECCIGCVALKCRIMDSHVMKLVMVECVLDKLYLNERDKPMEF